MEKGAIFLPEVDYLPNTFFYGVRTKLQDRIEADRCENCGTTAGYFEVHHIRKMKDIKKGKARWQKMMIARRRKTMILCIQCHSRLHRGTLSDRRYPSKGITQERRLDGERSA